MRSDRTITLKLSANDVEAIAAHLTIATDIALEWSTAARQAEDGGVAGLACDEIQAKSTNILHTILPITEMLADPDERAVAPSFFDISFSRSDLFLRQDIESLREFVGRQGENHANVAKELGRVSEALEVHLFRPAQEVILRLSSSDRRAPER